MIFKEDLEVIFGKRPFEKEVIEKSPEDKSEDKTKPIKKAATSKKSA